VYDELKKRYPDLPIFATVTLHNMRNPDWDTEKHEREIRAFLNEKNDMAGISFYPFMNGAIQPSDKPVESLNWLREFVGDKPIAITETGYPAETIRLGGIFAGIKIPSNEEKQATYFRTLLETATRDNYEFVIDFLHRDYDALWDKIKSFAPEAFKVWKDCGLLDGAGEERPAYEVWMEFFRRSRRGNEK
jgi:hypothetical protein